MYTPIATIKDCKKWKALEAPRIEYSGSELYTLYLDYKDENYRNMRHLFFGEGQLRKEPGVKKAFELLKVFQSRLRNFAVLDKIKLKNNKKDSIPFCLTLYHFMYEVPMKHLPLYINTDIYHLKIAFKWRMKLGK